MRSLLSLQEMVRNAARIIGDSYNRLLGGRQKMSGPLLVMADRGRASNLKYLA
jgi:hypothetical protein